MFKHWLLAIRPKTLPAAMAPVLIGTAMAFGDGVMHVPSALAALFAALMIQIATNLVNDYCDFKKGADTKDRVGPVRVTQAGLINPNVVLLGAVISFVLSALACVYLIFRGGPVILMIGIASILSGIFYTAGKKPLGYLGLGDIFVFVFFGPVAVGGTYYVQAMQDINVAVILAGIAPGLLSTGILAVNNLRDVDTDIKVGKKTLAVRFGRRFAAREYLFCICGAIVTPLLVFLIAPDYWAVLIASLIGFLAIPLVKTVYHSTNGQELNGILAKTGRLLLIYSVLFSAGWILCSR
jgi:1,4-dihydroxy-2-naphthoate polyprenyltransferase